MSEIKKQYQKHGQRTQYQKYGQRTRISGLIIGKSDSNPQFTSYLLQYEFIAQFEPKLVLEPALHALSPCEA